MKIVNAYTLNRVLKNKQMWIFVMKKGILIQLYTYMHILRHTILCNAMPILKVEEWTQQNAIAFK